VVGGEYRARLGAGGFGGGYSRAHSTFVETFLIAMRKPFWSLIGCLVACVSLLGQGCTNAPDATAVEASKRVELKIWGVVDDVDAYEDVFKDYRVLHPNVTFQYRRFRLEEYEDALLNAFAEDRGPDIFLIHNTWIGKYLPKIAPMPASTKVAVQRTTGTVKKVTAYQVETQPSISIKKYKDQYPEAVLRDTIRSVNISTKPDVRTFEQRIVALPVSMDTLGMYVNKDLLNAAGIATIPTTWTQFQEAIPKLVKQDAEGKLLQAGAAIGTARNVERMPDLLAALMMQNGTEMSSDDGTPTFGLVPAARRDEVDVPPAYQAVSFYTDFANPTKEVYTWNADQASSLDAFLQGKVAFFFGYSYHLPQIRARAPKLNLSISSLPQIEGNPIVNAANYWTWTVSKKTKSSDLAWNVLNFLVTPPEVSKYLATAKRPAADKSLLSAQLDDEDIGVFSSQVLTAKSWYLGDDPRAMEEAFQVMVEHVLGGVEEIPVAVRNAQSKIAQTIQ
jgi:ABC-type glycerol-3-phosphate transport system substrate-binding protein